MARAAVRALRAGRPVIMPTDTVYGLVADASEERSAQSLARLKGRPASMPCALMAACVNSLLEALPELDGTAEAASRALLPGPLTLVLPNPAERFPWLAGARPATIGVRVPALPQVSREILSEVPLLASTSANLHGAPDPRVLADVPQGLREAAGALVDGGQLPGEPSTVLDLSGARPVVLRDGAVAAAEVLERLRRATPNS
ncbi:MAG: L-threonylcarbamoyladenylate synthase [Actinomycetia bacterium]|nr:L-threonylcarbamoyladenylate synthase [Actinomycetes bacterium]